MRKPVIRRSHSLLPNTTPLYSPNKYYCNHWRSKVQETFLLTSLCIHHWPRMEVLGGDKKNTRLETNLQNYFLIKIQINPELLQKKVRGRESYSWTGAWKWAAVGEPFCLSFTEVELPEGWRHQVTGDKPGLCDWVCGIWISGVQWRVGVTDSKVALYLGHSPNSQCWWLSLWAVMDLA